MSEAQCKATADGAGSNFLFQVDDFDGSRIQRYGRSLFDGRGRFLRQSRAAFWKVNAEVELTTSEVLSRGAFGDVTEARDINGVRMRSVTGGLGRAYYSKPEVATLPIGK